MPEKLSLHRKLAQVMYEAETIPKNGVGPREQGSYPFVRVGDAADHIRKALAEKVVTMMPTAVHLVGQSDRPTSKGGTMTTVDLIVDWTITDGESGETIVLQTFGAGADTGDKYSGKAMTSAMKYAFLAGFLLSTGDDTENADTSDRRSTPPPTPEPREGSLIGVAEAAKAPHDLEFRTAPDGSHSIGFGLKEGEQIVRVIAHAELAEQIGAFVEAVAGKRLTVFGTMRDAEWIISAGTKKEKRIPYIQLTASHLTGADGFVLPLPAPATEARPPSAAGTTTNGTPTDRAGRTSEPEPETPSGSPSLMVADWTGAVTVLTTPVEEAGASVDTAEALPSVPDDGGAGADAASMSEAAPALCRAVGSDFGTVCGLVKGHANKHKELATDGRVLAAW